MTRSKYALCAALCANCLLCGRTCNTCDTDKNHFLYFKVSSLIEKRDECKIR